MNEEHLLLALSDISEEYILSAAPAPRKCAPRTLRWLAAVLALALGAALFVQTTPGAATATFLRQQVSILLQTLFPPKEVTATPEGELETGLYEAGGQLTEADVPGFVIYYDTQRYTLVEDTECTYLRPLTPSEDLPPCEIEIRHLPAVLSSEAAESARKTLLDQWASVTEVALYEPLSCPTFRVQDGTDWDSPVERWYFLPDWRGGTYQLILRDFVEAEEGHGERLAAALNTFTVLAP